ncbi:hypothetical protein M0813_03112 [Anaeramoeba flamelloides]|uniref:PSI domain-containing protein n=1 Tax=Anaeramoeba flamelloides TaxID=1746091 RepID=A0ABQ8Y746_9EUKA|nr:hypothetical protein M0813_03112 [Anaeramoeba flamelloides]
MKTKTSSRIFVFLFLVLSVKISSHRFTDDVCNFLYGDNCERCIDRDRPFHRWCGTYCSDGSSVDSGFSCSSSASCEVNQETQCPPRNNCEKYSGAQMCRVCIDHGCRWTNSDEGLCDYVEGSFTTVSSCESVPLSGLDCQMIYNTWAECTDDEHCSWIWKRGSLKPVCNSKLGEYDNNTNIYPDGSLDGNKFCELRENCDECHGVDCTWCYNPDYDIGYCVYSNDTIDNKECIYEVNPPWESCPSFEDTTLSNCTESNNCKNCTKSDCSWCAINGEANNGHCQESSKYCTSPDQNIEESQHCPSDWVDECQTYTNCSKCNLQLNCGWCETDSLLHTGKCFYKNPSPSVDECIGIEYGEWKTECTDPSSCLESTDCDQCNVTDGCTWCYWGKEESQCIPADVCTSKQGTAIDECNKNDLNIYDCESKSNCEDCFTEYPWCQWRYTGDWYQTQKCVFWSEPKVDTHILDAMNCDTFVACQNRTECSDCVETSDDVLSCIWCKDSGKEYCHEYSEDQDDDNCSKICFESDDGSSSPGDVIKSNFFCWLISFFMLLFYLTGTKLEN